LTRFTFGKSTWSGCVIPRGHPRPDMSGIRSYLLNCRWACSGSENAGGRATPPGYGLATDAAWVLGHRSHARNFDGFRSSVRPGAGARRGGTLADHSNGAVAKEDRSAASRPELTSTLEAGPGAELAAAIGRVVRPRRVPAGPGPSRSQGLSLACRPGLLLAGLCLRCDGLQPHIVALIRIFIPMT